MMQPQNQMLLLPLWFKVVSIVVGAALFLFQIFLTVSGLRGSSTRHERLESLGAAIPGLSGLIIIAALFCSHPMLGLALVAIAILNLVVGRACYELLLISLSRRVAKGGPGER